MEYNKFEEILNKTIHEDVILTLLNKLIKDSKRFTSKFNLLSIKDRLVKNILYSVNIKFGYIYEKLFEYQLKENNFKQLISKVENEKGEKLDIDQLVEKNNKIYLIEQKIRDDHDSSKKEGQINNFNKKINFIKKIYLKPVHAFFWFVDSKFNKNEKYYDLEIKKLIDRYKIDIKLCYGKTLYDYLNMKSAWQEIDEYFNQRENNGYNISDIDLNLDKNPQKNFNTILKLEPVVISKLFYNKQLNCILNMLFPEKETIKLLKAYLNKKCIIINTKNKITLEDKNYLKAYEAVNNFINN